MPQVLQFPKRQTLRDLCEPSREQDEALLRVIAAYEAEGGQVLFSGESSEEGEPSPLASGRYVERTAPSATAPHQNRLERDAVQGQATLDDPRSPNNFVSEYLTRPLRTEQQAREDRAKLHPVFASIFDAFGMRGL